MVATKYKNTVTNFFADKGIRAECVKLMVQLNWHLN